jgi:hypothetical protein
MNTNPLKKGVISENFAGVGAVTHDMVRQRAIELAIINGRAAQEVSKSDWEQAKRELTGEPDADPDETMYEAIPDSDRVVSAPFSTGHKTPESPNEDEDDEGRSESEQLVEEGVAEAEHDQMLQAAKEAAKKDR